MKFNHLMGVVALSTAPVLSYADAYDVQELPVSDLSVNQFSVSIDNSGLALVGLENPYNPPIDLTLLDVSLFPGLSDPEGAAQGNFESNDYNGLVATFRSNGNNLTRFGQKLATNIGFKTDGTDAEYVAGFDIQRESTNGFTFSTNARLEGSVNGDFIIGNSQGVFYPFVFTNDTDDEITAVINDFLLRGFVQVNGETKSLMPIDDTLSGRSEAKAINQNLQVAGSSSVIASDAISTAIEACNDPTVTIPLEICLYDARARLRDQYIRRATIWQLDAQGETISTTSYDLSFTPADDDVRNYFNEAVDINSQGVAVGSGSVLGEFRTRTLAMIYENGMTRQIFPEEQEPEDTVGGSVAVAINDNGLVAGYQAQLIGGSAVASKMFVYDTNTQSFTFPSDFFNTSNTFPRAINNNGIIVGDAEIEATGNPRPRAGFMYNIATDEFINLNTLIACDSPYLIVAANSINDNNEIIADAVLLRPQLNALGEPVFDANGEALNQSAVVAVKLNPTGAEAPTCPLDEVELQDTVRQGASNSLLFIIFCFSVLGLRRFKR